MVNKVMQLPLLLLTSYWEIYIKIVPITQPIKKAYVPLHSQKLLFLWNQFLKALLFLFPGFGIIIMQL